MRVADWAITLLGAWTAFTGAWGVVAFVTGGSEAPGDDILWIGTALFAAGIALVLIGAGRLRGRGAI